jgi:hypothetical protein
MREKQDAPSKRLGRTYYDGMDRGKGRRVEKGDRIKVRISQRLEDKPEIGLHYTEGSISSGHRPNEEEEAKFVEWDNFVQVRSFRPRFETSHLFGLER